MNTKTFASVAALVLLAGACSSQDPSSTAAAGRAAGAVASPAAGAAMPMSMAGQPGAAAIAGRGHPSRAAALPDRGELVTYPGDVARTSGAYTWHRAGISEAHALNAIASGHLRLTTPDGRLLDIVYDRHVEHPNGDWSWIGHLAGHQGMQTVLTIGAEAVFGSIGQEIGLPLRVTMRDGLSWLVETDAAKVAALDSEATRPTRPDFHVPLQRNLPRQAAAPAAATPLAPVAGALAGDGAIVDVLVGYTDGFRASDDIGSASAAETRINFLVDTTNAAYENGGIDGRVRLVHAMEVDYTDSNDNGLALEQLSGYASGSGPVTPNPAFDDLRAARETYGADLVVLLRDFRDPENGGCGIAWLLGGGLQGIAPGEGWDELGYSVVSNGTDENEDDGKSYYCRDSTFAHELGHNMGAAHDRETSEGGDGTLDNPDDYGAYTYSFGEKTPVGDGNFYTVMAYGVSGQIGYNIFSTPDTNYCGGHACGDVNTDNVKTLNNTQPVVAGFRDSVVPVAGGTRNDFDGDGTADILWRNLQDGRNNFWRSADPDRQVQLATLADQDWKVAAIGDFDGDGVADIFWQNLDTLANMIWKSGDSDTRLPTDRLLERGWSIVGVGDFNGDGNDDVLWRNGNHGRNTIWYSGDKAQRQPINQVSDTRFHVEGVGDYDGDGHDDILWRNVGYGKNVVWFSGTKSQRMTIKPVADTTWHVVGVGDFDADGRDDLMWRNSVSGRNSIWKGADAFDKIAVNTVGDVDFKAELTRDFDGNGTADILWRNASSGKTVVWPSADRGQRRELGFFTLDWIVAP